MPSEQEKFLKDLEPSEQSNVFEAVVPEPEKESEPEPEARENRRERRTQAKLRAERESNIFLAAKLEALTEAQKFSRDAELTPFEEKAMRIYGNETPEARIASELLIASLKDVQKSAREEALQAIREEREKESQSIHQEEQSLDSMIDDIEDESGTTLTAQDKKGFFTLLEKLSPKDRDGNITDYADPYAVWEEYQARKPKPDTRAKDLASRGMTQSSGATAATNLQEDVTSRYLRENGLI